MKSNLWKLGAILIAILINTSNSHASPLPMGDLKYYTETQEYFMCYDIQKYKLVLTAFADLSTCEEHNGLLEQKIGLLEGNYLAVQRQNQELQNVNIFLSEENDRLYQKWEEQNLRMHEAENSPNWSAWGGWIAAGVATIGAGLAITYAATK